MRAWLMDGFEGTENLRLAEVDDPKPGPREVLLRVKFAALNPADAFLAKAMYPAKPRLPHVLGRDGVGDVIGVGEGVDTALIGSTVGVMCSKVGADTWGTLAEKVVVPMAETAPLPQGWTLEEMAGAPLVFLTAWQALTQWSEPPAPPPRGSVLLVTGASGGVGAATVLLGKSMGLTVVALSRSAEKGARLKELGADFVFQPEDPNLYKAVLTAVAPKRVDVAVDSVGGGLFNQVVAMMGHYGRISVVGRSAGVVPEFNTASLFFRRIRVGGVAVTDDKPEVARTAWKNIVERLNAEGKRPIIDNVFEFGDVKAAFERLAQGPMGKVVVRVAGL